jgi:hypothetical protein
VQRSGFGLIDVIVADRLAPSVCAVADLVGLRDGIPRRSSARDKSDKFKDVDRPARA